MSPENCTNEGQENSFDLDIVYSIPSDITTIPSPIQVGLKINAFTIENILADKLATVHRFRGGNSRMKDFDDLWRICISQELIDWERLQSILNSRGVPPLLKESWINPQMENSWHAHIKRNSDLPSNLNLLIKSINNCLQKKLGIEVKNERKNS